MSKNFDKVVAFDVDGTLIHLSNDTPRYNIIELLRKFVDLGCRVIVGSGGGFHYAHRWVTKLGLEKLVEVVDKDEFQKADIVFDDDTNSIGKVGIFV